MVLQRFLAVSKAIRFRIVCLRQKSYEKLMEHHTACPTPHYPIILRISTYRRNAQPDPGSSIRCAESKGPTRQVGPRETLHVCSTGYLSFGRSFEILLIHPPPPFFGSTLRNGSSLCCALNQYC